MSKKLSGIFWGIVLVVAGVYGLAQTMGYEVPQEPRVWVFIFAGISLFALVFYLVDGLKQWGWLFPVLIFAALAVMLFFVDRGADHPAMAAPLFIAIGIPFLVAYLQNRKEHWWALIPMGIMAFLTLVLLVVENAPGEWIGTGLFWILAVVFFSIYMSRKAMWAALVAYIFLILGFMPVLGSSSRPELAGIILFIAIGLPFLFVYLRKPDRWWALIPAGIMLTLGIVTGVVLFPGMSSALTTAEIVGNALLYAGFAATFAVVWLRHHFRWAMLVTILGAVLAVASLFLKSDMSKVWPFVIIVVGGFLLYRSFRREKIS